MSKERVILLFCTNKMGSHKLKSLCGGKYRRLRCFKHINVTSLPVICMYKSSKNAWMNSDIFLALFDEKFVPAVKNCLH
jgi:hypothetical protein